MNNLLGSALFRIGQRARGTSAFQLLQTLREEPFRSPENARERQLQRLREIVAYCETRVPFYRCRFAEAGVSSRDLKSLQDFSRFPVLTKRDLAEHAEALVPEGIDRAALQVHHSGGSTGVPVKFYRDATYIAASEAGTYRNLLQCGWRPGELIGFFWGWNERLAQMSRVEFVARQLIRRMYQFDPFHAGAEDMVGWWRTWRMVRPAVALGYASTIARFARYLEDHGLRPRPLRGVFTTAEKLFGEQRKLIERVFNCRVFDCYGSSEVQNIASECAHGRMHINTDFAVVELVEAEALADGSAPLLVTSLRNFAMPILRYRNEDTGALVQGYCDCGNGFPLMSLEVARISDSFKLPNGRIVHGEFFTHLMYGSEGIESFQFHQVNESTIVLRYIPAAKGNPNTVLASAVAQIEALAPGQLRVEVQSVPEIPLSTAGKHRFTRSEVN